MKLLRALSLPLLIAACADTAGYPSLLPRATERTGFAEPSAPAPEPVAADPALDARIAAIDARGGSGEAALAAAEQRVAAARGAAAGTEKWLDAQIALGDLDARRSDEVAALTDLEALASERAVALAPDYPPLERAIAAARTAIDARDARIAALQAALAPVEAR